MKLLFLIPLLMLGYGPNQAADILKPDEVHATVHVFSHEGDSSFRFGERSGSSSGSGETVGVSLGVTYYTGKQYEMWNLNRIRNRPNHTHPDGTDHE